MADRKSSSSGGVSSHLSVRRKDRAENVKKEEKPPKEGEIAKNTPVENRESTEKPEPMEFEIISG